MAGPIITDNDTLLYSTRFMDLRDSILTFLQERFSEETFVPTATNVGGVMWRIYVSSPLELGRIKQRFGDFMEGVNLELHTELTLKLEETALEIELGEVSRARESLYERRQKKINKY